MEENNNIYPISSMNKDYRLRTMMNWARPFSDRRLLADAGFYLMHYGNTRETIKCAYCDLEISGSTWETGVEPVEIHKNLSPRCWYIKHLKSPPTATICQPTCSAQNSKANKSRKPSEVVRASIFKINSTITPTYQMYITEEERLQSFKFAVWPRHFKSQPDYLSKVGFFYLGRKTMAACFQCGGMYEFEEQDDAFVEHKLFFPSCFLVVQYNLLEDTSRLCSRFKRFLKLASDSSKQLANSNPTSEKGENQKLCRICFQRNWSNLMYPCGHVTCDFCAKNLTDCAFCRQRIEDRVRVYTEC